MFQPGPASSSPSSDSTARVDDHHGLGLSNVRAIANDATLTANARPQGGLPIEIHFPLTPFAMPR